MNVHHTPVMVQEILTALHIKPDGSYIDCTIGEGGHSHAIIGAEQGVHLLGIDMDVQALDVAEQRLKEHSDRLTLVQGNFADVELIAEDHEFGPVDGILMDLGISSLQVETQNRGFSFRLEARLDMRMDSQRRVTAFTVVNGYSEGDLANIIYQLGEEPRSRRVARAIVRNRPIETTTRLADVVKKTLGQSRKSRIHPATRTFQAIRIAVNGELENLEQGLGRALELLKVGGRIAVISYHSLEDRLVKSTFRREASECICPPKMPQCVCDHQPIIKLVNRRVLRPTPEEVRANPRSRSARLRVAERI